MLVHAGGIEWDYGTPLHASQHRRNGFSLPRNVNSFAFGRLLMLVIDPKHPISPNGSSPLARGEKRQLWRSASGVTVWLGRSGLPIRRVAPAKHTAARGCETGAHAIFM